jgi:hypothetical protein
VIEERSFISPLGRRYRILKTDETDAYESGGETPEPGGPADREAKAGRPKKSR